MRCKRFDFLGDGENRIFFCGIGGISMLSLALLTRERGYKVFGSDLSPDDETVKLCRENGIPLFFSHDAEHVDGCDVFVYTAAIKEDNPEFIYAKASKMRIFTRSEYLGAIADGFSSSIAIAGTHGKSSVTHLTDGIFKAFGKSPSLLAGAKACKSTLAYESGENGIIIYEACEYNRSFLDFRPDISVILNIEKEHTDIYPTLESSEEAFFEFAKKSRICVLNKDNASCVKVGERLTAKGVKTVYFSMSDSGAELYANNINETRGFYSFDIFANSQLTVRNIKMKIPGLHSVQNSLAAAATAYAYGLTDGDTVKKGIEDFRGIRRRFEYIGRVNGADVYDDYAHHPTEIRSTLKTASSLGYEKIICAFQPHTYSRTYEFFDEFSKCFSECDEVIFADIFPAREKNVFGVTSSALAAACKNGKYIKSFDEIYRYLLNSSHPKTLILTMGAGKLDEIAKRLVFGEDF